MQTITNINPWIRTPFFDFSFITGGAFFTLFIAFLSFQFPTMVPVFFWIWVVFFEGSHFWATYSRTYIDDKYRKQNSKVLYYSLVFFIFPIVAIVLENQIKTISFTVYYGFFIFVWSLYHNAKQHYGFLSIYAAKIKLEFSEKSKMVQSLYAVIVFSQVYFLINFKLQGTFSIGSFFQSTPILNFMSTNIFYILTLLGAFYFIYQAVQLQKKYGSKILPIVSYIATCLIFYSLMFYYIAHTDHFITKDGVSVLILIAIMNSLFHNIQYHAIVWHYGQKRYNEKEETQGFGIAKFVNGKTLNYLITALLIGAVFGFIVWNVGSSPNINGSFTSNANNWAYVLFFGIIGHHFYLDQKIWRPSKQSELKSYLS
jgi:hypothetical protein